jgi:putative ABC transport system permease protein
VRALDLLGFALSALGRHRLRTLLTTLGVTFGTAVLAASLSVRMGVQKTILRQASKFNDLRRIEIHPLPGDLPRQKPPEVKGQMSAARRQRLQAQAGNYQPRPEVPPRTPLTRQALRAIVELDHVVSVRPVIFREAFVVLGGRSQQISTFAVEPGDEKLRDRLVAGAPLRTESGRDALVDEYLLYQLGLIDEAAVTRALGRPLRVEFRYRQPQPAPANWLEGLLATVQPPPMGVEAEEFTLRGVVRAAETEGLFSRNWMYHNANVFLSARGAEDLYLRLPEGKTRGFEAVTVEVDEMDHVKAVKKQLDEMGLRTHTPLDWIEREQFTYLLIFTAMSMVALIALVVSALGITNTMLMSVLERTREIGVMKAVGARDRDVLLALLVEGALVGLVGGALGLAICWGASHPGDAYVRSLVSSRLKVQLDGSIFAFPAVLLVGAPAFAALVTTTAALYPARRAVRINPVEALRHE